MKLLVKFHGILDEDALLYSNIQICGAIFMKEVANMLCFGDPGEVITTQLNWGKSISCVAIECNAHGLALLRY